MKRKKGALWKEFKKNKFLWLMLLPGIVTIFIFAYLPMGGVILAFKEFRYAGGIFGSPWVGLDNFKFFFLSGNAWRVTRNTFLYNAAFILVNTTLAVTLAIILSEIKNKIFKKVTQSFIFLPYFVSWVIVGSIAYNLLNYENGTLNGILLGLGLNPIDVYRKTSWWPFIIILFNAWKNVGYTMVVYLAAVVGVDTQLLEAAQIDGANIFQRIKYVTFPSIRPIIITMVLLDVGKIFRGNLELFYQLIGNNGMLFDVTDVIDTFVFRSLIRSSEVGMAAASGLYQSILCLVTIVLVNWLVRRVNKDYALF